MTANILPIIKWFRNRRRLTKPATPAKVIELSQETWARVIKLHIDNAKPQRRLG